MQYFLLDKPYFMWYTNNIIKREIIQMFTYSEELFSDLHKDAYGFRPRGHKFDTSTPAEKQVIWDETISDMYLSMEAEKARTAEYLEDFKAQVEKVINVYGAEDREQALRWMTQEDTFYHSQDVESWVYDKGILFTDYGKELVKELMHIVDQVEDEEYIYE